MGRWGFRMFQGDRDQDAAVGVQEVIGVQLVGKHPGDMFDSIADEPFVLEEARIKLDSGLSAQIMSNIRNNGPNIDCQGLDRIYGACVLGAIMMHVGAKLSLEDRQHLKSIFPGTSKVAGFALPITDGDFRKPGAVQVGAALENYVDGQPRSFTEPSCFNCGKIKQERVGGKKLLACKRCLSHSKPFAHRVAYYCNSECQKENWNEHKVICRPPGGMLNV